MPRPLDEELVDDLVDAGSREHYADAALYDHEYRRRRADVAFYRGLARRLLGGPGRVLELGCGSGRATLPLARDGHAVVAVDRAPTMLARLEARLARAPAAVRARVTTARGDLRDVAVGGRFPLVIATFNVLEHLYTRVELAACLDRVRAHLAPGGLFAFDVQQPDLRWLSRDPDRRWARTRFTHPVTGARLEYSTSHDYDPISQIALIRLYYAPVDGDGPTRIVKLSQRKYFPAELEALLAASGFAVHERYGGFDGSPPAADSDTQIVVAGPMPGAAARRKRT
ncbi:MAG: methyltransferase domain-containing protein [Kofleriaceae bacterium]